jgi:phospholipid N-methyltransferase
MTIENSNGPNQGRNQMDTETISNGPDQETTEQPAGASCYMSATYDPSDDKIRLEAMSRLTPEEYARAKAAGFRWAPMQKVFYTVWNPTAEALAIEWCGTIEDSDKTLVDRAEERADRFETYSDNRAKDADRAQAAVHAIADNIPLGQPILVGHHSERHARRDAEKIENGMRRAVNMWKTSEYWKQRAAGALHHAQYKELPGVRARRIKGLEADLRRYIASFTPRKDSTVIMQQDHYERYPLNGPGNKDAPEVPHVFVGPAGRGGHWVAERHLAGIERRARPWIEHISNRLEYEHALLEEAGATNLLAKKPKSAAAQLPLCNYDEPKGVDTENKWNRGEMLHYAQKRMTQAEYAAINQDYKGTRVIDNSHRVRTAMVAHGLYYVFLTDSKVHERPAAVVPPPPTPRPTRDHVPQEPKPADPAADTFRAMEQSLKAGVKVIAVNQLFPTPAELAARMVEMADIQPEHKVLEPSAGEGAIVREIPRDCRLTAVEINWALCKALERSFPEEQGPIHHADFLELGTLVGDPIQYGTFDRVIMNPPFENGADIKHIAHALKFLKPGGRLVAICANGPRQQAALAPVARSWEPLPAGTFAGTGVSAALIEISNGTDQTK